MTILASHCSLNRAALCDGGVRMATHPYRCDSPVLSL